MPSNITTGVGVGFLTGTQESIRVMLGQGTNANAIEGYFYLAEDTHRLYIGNHDGSISAVNEGIYYVNSLADLEQASPTETDNAGWKALQGQFYYVSGENILCVCSGKKWVQINHDTYLIGSEQQDYGSVADSTINTGIVAVTAGGTQNSALIKTRIQDTHGQEDANNNKIPIHTAAGRFLIQGGNNVTVTADTTHNTINIDAPDGAKYDFTYQTISNTAGNHQVDLVLTERGTNGEVDRVSFFDGDSVYPVVENNKLVFKGGGLSDMTATVSMDSSTHALQILLQNNLDQLPIKLIPAITVGTGNNAAPVYGTYTPGTNNAPGTLSFDLNIYSKSEIDALLASELNSLDAMYFAGTLGTNGTVPSLTALKNGKDSSNNDLNLHSGATFKVISPIGLPLPSGMTIEGWPTSANDETMEVGDMIIVTGTETNGVITSNVKYTYIPSGDNDDIYFQPDFTQHNKEAWFTNHIDNNEVHKLKFAAGNSGKISVTGATSGNDQTITVEHATLTAPTPTSGTQVTQSSSNEDPEYTAITGLTFDGYGHVSGYQTTKLKLWSNHLSEVLSQATVTNSTSNGITTYNSKIANTYKDANGTYQLFDGSAGAGNADVNNWGISSSTLKIDVGNAGSSSNAAMLNVNMVWGSFSASV